jgi:nucleotide-binding universal stress UspA family protein
LTHSTWKEVEMPGVIPSVDVRLKSVLVATDFSKASERPIRRALAIAQHFGAKFYLAHVVSSIGYTIAGPEALELALEASARDVKQLEKNWLADGSLAGLEHEFLVAEGIVWKELQSIIEQRQIDLVVVGTHARQNLSKLLLGSVAEQIFRRSDCLVLTVGPGSVRESPLEDRRAFRPLLFATDFGDASLRALPYAISFANHFSTKLVLLHVEPINPVPEGFHWSSTSSDPQKLRDDARYKAVERLREILSHQAPLTVKPEFVVKFGAPGETILRVAAEQQADLIVIGLNRTRHVDTACHTPWATAYAVVCEAACPVLTVRG